jgi:UDP-N-acetylglucosamine 2-epimerase (non-hydrolysing)
MPEEINRILTDAISDILFTPSLDGDENLKREGFPPERIKFVGNVMIDTLEIMRQKIEIYTLKQYLKDNEDFGLITLHRPSNVDNNEILESIVNNLLDISKKIHLIFPVHPRTKKQLELHGYYNLLDNGSNINITEPLSYLGFMKLLFSCKFVLTDSGGLQEETTYLGIPCLTLRANTERPITVLQGTNELVTVDDLKYKVEQILMGNSKKGSIPKYWDGKTADRIISALIEEVQKTL